MTLLPALALMIAVPPAGEEASVAPAHDQSPQAFTHAPDEIAESDETHNPLLLHVVYTGEVIGNASGGLRRGTRYLDNLNLIFEANFEQLVGWSGARAHVYGLYNNGTSISDLVGDTQAVSNIETGTSALRLYEAWIDQSIGDNMSLRAGLYDLNSEFDALDSPGLFVSSPNGIGTDFAQSGRNGPSIFPSTSLAARIEVQPAAGWAVRTAILDGVPGDSARPGRTIIRLGGGDGVLLVGEIEAPLGGGKLLLGHWRYTAKFDLNDGSGTDTGNAGTYIRAEAPLLARSEERIDGFLRLGTASGRFNMFKFFTGAGFKFSGWIPGRDEDEFGIALAAAFTADSHRRLSGVGRSEIAIEATYRAQLNSWLSLQPNIHYVRRPSADPGIADALVLGLRAEVSFKLGF